MEAYILINAEAGMIWEVAEAALKIDGVRMAHAVTGQFDAVVMWSLRRLRSLEK